MAVPDYELLYESTLAAKQELDAQHKLLGDEVKRLNAELDAVRNKAAGLERTACADLVRQLRDSINEMSHRASAMRDALEQAEKHIRARGRAAVKGSHA